MGRLGQDKPAFGWELEPFWPLLLPIGVAGHAAGTMRGGGPPTPRGRESRAWYSPARMRMFSAADSNTC
jgi:hypothetical protein